MILKTIIVISFLIVFALNIFADKYHNERLRYLTKPLLVPLIIAFYCISADAINWLVVIGLFCGFLGDVFLLGKKDVFLLLGLCSFLTGHVFYSIAFLDSTNYLESVPIWFYLLTIPYIMYGIFVMSALWKHLGDKKIPAVLYITALLTMSFCSLGRVWNGFDLAFILPWAGSLLFIASDSSLGRSILADKNQDHEVFIMITYVMAQVMIMLGFLM